MEANIITVEISCNHKELIAIEASYHHRLLSQSARGDQSPTFLLHTTELLDLETLVKVIDLRNYHIGGTSQDVMLVRCKYEEAIL